jgi:hypothetical protein
LGIYPTVNKVYYCKNFNQIEGKAMSNRSIIIMVLVLVGATAYLLMKGDGNIDMGGEKHGAEAAHMEEAKKCPCRSSSSCCSTCCRC